MAQGVHDALNLNSSQRRREQRHVEALARSIDLGRSSDANVILLDNVRLQRGPGLLDPFFVGIDRENGRSIARVAERQAPVAAAELQNTKPRNRRKLLQSTSLHTLRVDAPTHTPSMT